MSHRSVLPQTTSAKRTTARFALATPALATALLLTACGGGGDSTPSAPLRSVVATSGDASKYVHWWWGECANAAGTTAHRIQANFNLMSSSGNKVTGLLNTSDYGVGSLNCITPVATASNVVTITIDSAPVAAAGVATGQADRVTIEVAGAAPQIAYIAFDPALSRFWLNDSPVYEAGNVAYLK